MICVLNTSRACIPRPSRLKVFKENPSVVLFIVVKANRKDP